MVDKKEPYLLGSDLGTSGCKSIIIDMQGKVCGWAIGDYRTIRNKEGWAEQDPEDWYRAFCETTRKAICQSGISPDQIVMVSIVGITHNAVLFDRQERLVRPSIIYTDTRSLAQTNQLSERWGDEVFKRTWNQLSSIWTWPQLLWIKENEPELWQRVNRILFPKDYIRHRLAPSMVSDTIDPVGTLLYDPMKNCWIEEFCSSLGLGLEVFPSPSAPLDIVGRVSSSGSEETGLLQGTPVITGTTDTAAEVIGVGAIRPGQAIIKLATVGRIMAVSDQPLNSTTILNYPHVIEGLWYPGTTTKFAASAYTWARNVFWDRNEAMVDFDLMNREAEAAPPGSYGLLFHPYLSGEFAPSWDPYLRASFLGVSINHNRSHFTRSVMEGVAFAIRDALQNISKMGLKVDEIRLIGGGSTSDLWAQIITDNLQREVIIPEATDAAYGAALLAGVAAGLFDLSDSSINKLIKIRKHIIPETHRMNVYSELFEIYRQSALSLSSISHKLQAFQASKIACKEASK